jgi:hypothetical protein
MSLQIALIWAAVFVTAGLIAYFSVKLRIETRKTRRALDDHQGTAAEITLLASRLTSVELQVQQIRDQRASHAEWISSSESLNLNRRGQVLRLHTRGDSVPAIADALRMGQAEVRLMIKVHELRGIF